MMGKEELNRPHTFCGFFVFPAIISFDESGEVFPLMTTGKVACGSKKRTPIAIDVI